MASTALKREPTSDSAVVLVAWAEVTPKPQKRLEITGLPAR